MNFYTIGYSGQEFMELLKKIETGEIVLSPEAKEALIAEILSKINVDGEGIVGPQGPQGEKGDQGEMGPMGPQGEMGPEGPAGKDGKDGKDFTYDMFTAEQLEALRGPQGEQGPMGPEGPAGKDGVDGKDAEPVDLTGYATEEYVQDAIKNVQVGDSCDLTDYAKKAFVEEQIAAIEHPQYDDSELKERVEVLETINLETKPYIDKDGMLVLCGCPAIARGVGDEVHVIVRFFNDAEDKFVFTKDEFAKLRICMGYGAEGVGTKRNIVETTLEMYDIDKAYVIDGGSQITGEIGTVNIIAERVNYIHGIQGARAMQGGERNIIHNFNVNVKDVELLNILFCGGNGYSVTWNSNVVIDNTTINALHGGGSNGYTNSTVIEMNNGIVNKFYGVNRGIVDRYKFILNDGQVKDFWAGCDEGNPVVNAVELELNGGQIDKFQLGVNGEGNLNPDIISGHIMDCVVVEGDVSMLEIKVKEEQQEQGIDLSEYAKIEFVQEQIANIELKEGAMGPQGPAGQDGKDFTFDMFTEEQLEALRGPQGENGKDGLDGAQGEVGPQGPQGEQGPAGEKGQDGKDFTYDMFTDEQLKALVGPQGPEGVQGPMGPQGEAGLQGPQGEVGPQGPEGLKGDKGDTGEQGPAGQDGVSVISVEVKDGHLMVHLSNNTVVDAGELPVGEGGSGSGGGASSEEVKQMQAELVETKQQLLDLTYGVEYEWIYFYDQPSTSSDLGFNQATAPGFYEDWLPVLETEDEALIEEFIVRMYEEDIYRMYVLKGSAEHRLFNRYELLPLDGHTIQPINTYLPTWNPVKSLTSWNWKGDEDGGFFIDAAPTSPMSFAFLKVKK